MDQETSIHVPYTEGEWNGQLGSDVVQIATAPNFSATAYVSCITQSKDFYVQGADWQGILGLAYKALSRVSFTQPARDSLFISLFLCCSDSHSLHFSSSQPSLIQFSCQINKYQYILNILNYAIEFNSNPKKQKYPMLL